MQTQSREITTGNDLLGALLPLVVDSVRSPHSKRAYARGVRNFVEFCTLQALPFTPATVQRYRSSLESAGKKPVTVNMALSAIRKLAQEASRNGLMDKGEAREIKDLPDSKRHGEPSGRWLDKAQLINLLDQPRKDTHRGRRDRALLWILGTAGLRLAEACSLRVDQLQSRDGRAVLVDVAGKGEKPRIVPIINACVDVIRAWMGGAGITDGKMLRGVSGGVITDGLSVHSVHTIVRRHSKRCGVIISPHDLRRTFGRAAHLGGADLKQIQAVLGHSSVATTERYLRIGVNITQSPCDSLGDLRPPSTAPRSG